MSKKSVSSLELAAIINELQILVKGKISQIYHQDKEIILQLHAPSKGKKLLKIVPGKLLCFTNEKNAPQRPSGFCMQLRKYLSNAFIKAISQKETERIVVFELEKKEKYYLIIELFSKGNIILTDNNYLIIGALQRQIWKDRIVKNKEKYVFPTPGLNWKNLTTKKLKEIVNKSEKRNLATTLATELNMGGLLAEEICLRADVDKDIKPKEVKEFNKLLETIKNILKLIEKTKGYIYEKEITPFPLLGKEAKEIKKTYNEAIDTINPFQTVSPYKQKIAALERRILEQEEAIKSQEKKIEENSKKGELIYEKYAPLQKLLNIVKELKKTWDWVDIGKQLKKEKEIKSVNLKDKKVIINVK